MNTRKPLALHTGHHTQVEIEQMKRENEAATLGRSILDTVPKELIDGAARKEWKRIVNELKEFEIIGNVDASNLIGYCNAYSLYVKATKELSSQSLVIHTEKGPQTNPLVRTQDMLAKQMRDFAAKSGISVDTRLKLASLKVKNEDDEIFREFGDI